MAHRGVPGPGAPENSLAALGRALDLGAPAVELDVMGLEDGAFAVSHGRSSPSPPLGPYLAALRLAPAVILVLDWKGGGAEPEVARLLETAHLAARTVVTTSDSDALMRFGAAAPALSLGLTLPGEHQGSAWDAAALARAAGASAVSLDSSSATPDRLAAIRREGLGLFLWTARDECSYRRLLWYRPDGIMTDALSSVMGRELRPLGPGWRARLLRQ